jgi:hypothetical protein
MGGALASRCVVRVYGADGAVRLQSHGTTAPIDKIGAENHILQLNI